MSCSDAARSPRNAASADAPDSLATVNDSTATQDRSNARKDDARLASEVVESMYAKTALVQQGQEKATTPAVKRLAKELETAYTALNGRWKYLVVKNGWALPSGESAVAIKERTELGEEEAAVFEKKWLREMEDRHEATIKKLANSRSQDAVMQALCAESVARLKELLKNIKTVRESLE